MADVRRISLGRAYVLASSIINELRRSGAGAATLVPVGGLRRFSPDIGDVTLLASGTGAEAERLLNDFCRLGGASNVLERSDSHASLATDNGRVSLVVASAASTGAAMVWYTGSRGHVARLAERATERGLDFGRGELRDAEGDIVPCETEEQLYAALGIPFIPAEIRHGDDELEAALEGRLPALVSGIHIRGDLHMHTTYSDGRDSVAEMAAACVELGYEYLAITDHSERAWSSRKLSVHEIDAQRAEIDEARQQFHNVTILHGVEVDIMKDGTLDFPDAILAQFDIVLASLHDHGGQSRLELTERYLSAIRHPLVNVITHPTNRAPAHSEGYDIDLDRLFAAAAETGTAMEIDGAPGHLDMDGAVARRAVAAGVMVVIDSDCHRAEWLGRQMRFGVGTARRGWVEPQHVLNARPVEAVREFVARKRARG